MAALRTRETMIALRATRAAHRLAGDVAVSRIKDLVTTRCAACSGRFIEEPGEPGGRTLCPACRAPRTGPTDPFVARVVCFVDILCAELRLARPGLVIENPAAFGGPAREPLGAGTAAHELWRFNGWRLEVLRADDDGDYRPVASSAALSFLPIADLEQLLVCVHYEGDETVRRAFQTWVRALRP